jgi:hypothetical protein
MDLKNYIVPKPWGYEYLVFENEYVGIWFLHIDYNERTSLHCHPDKKTGLIILRGEAAISFLSNSIVLPEFGKTMIREGFFHMTYAQSVGGVDLIEIENPKNKENLVRMEDIYGRKGTQYETKETWQERNNSHLWVDDKIGEVQKHLGYTYSVCKLTEEFAYQLHPDSSIIVLSKVGLVTKNREYAISKAGDVAKVSVVLRLLNDFIFENDVYGLIIEKK